MVYIMSSEKLQTRERVLEAAWRLMERTHGRSVRMRDIAETAGVSRQAVYLHFGSRTELMIAVTHYVDQVLGLDERLGRYRAADTGVEIMDAFVEFWGNYILEIYGVAKALLAERETDEAAAAAWNDRMTAVRSGCRRAIEALHRDEMLGSEWAVDEAIDLFWTMLSVRNWENLIVDCGWSIDKYVNRMQTVLKCTFIHEQGVT